MKKLLFVSLFLLACLFPAPAKSQDWSGVLSASRAPGSNGWADAGAGTIPARTTICTTVSLFSGSGNAATNGSAIRSAIAGCTAGQTVMIPAGTWYIDYIWFGTSLTGMVSDVTLRGAGANSTFLIFTTGSGCTGLGADICIANQDGGNFFSGAPQNVAAWSSGYSKGTTTITLGAFSQGSLSNLHIGSTLILDQNDDGLTDPGNIWVCQVAGVNPSCAYEGGDSGLPGAAQTQMVQVTNISGSTITISPGLYAPNWRSSQNPVVWFSNYVEVTGDGVESMTLDHTQSQVNCYASGAAGIMITNTYGSWVKNVRSLVASIACGANTYALGKHVWFYQANHNTVRDSYFYGSNGGSGGYGVDSGTVGSDNLIENNIFQHISGGEITEGDSGSVFGYNYSVDNFYNAEGSAPNAQQEEQYNHSAGGHYTLWEGDEGIGMVADTLHGTSFMLTLFREFLNGRDPALTSDLGTGNCAGIPPTGTSPCAKTAYTAAVNLKAGSREMNILGSVLGTSGYHNTYTVTAPSSGDCGTANNLAVYVLDYSGNSGQSATCSLFPFPIANDLNVHQQLYRWGNYDTVNAAVQWNSSEVPSGLPIYAQAVPGSHALPNSFYLPSAGASAPPFWISSIPWPAVGPDVSGGNVTGVGGHVYLTPAANCYLNIMGGLTNGSSGVLPFDSSTCGYGSGGGGGTAQIAFSPTSINFGTVVAGNDSAEVPLTISNPGTAPLTWTGGITITDSLDFEIVSIGTCISPIAAMSSCTLQTEFSPVTPGNFSTQLVINDNAGGPHSVPLTGIATASSGPIPAPPTGVTATVTP